MTINLDVKMSSIKSYWHPSEEPEFNVEFTEKGGNSVNIKIRGFVTAYPKAIVPTNVVTGQPLTQITLAPYNKANYTLKLPRINNLMPNAENLRIVLIAMAYVDSNNQRETMIYSTRTRTGPVFRFWRYYDFDNDGKINDSELNAAISDWNSNKLTDDEIMDIIMKWTNPDYISPHDKPIILEVDSMSLNKYTFTQDETITVTAYISNLSSDTQTLKVTLFFDLVDVASSPTIIIPANTRTYVNITYNLKNLGQNIIPGQHCICVY